MNVSELFSHFIPGAKAAPAVAPAATTPATPAPVTGQIPASAQAAGATQVTAATAPNGVVPAGASDPAAGSNLDQFKDILSNVSTPAAGQPLFTTSKDQLLELARKQDFKPQLTPEQIQAIAGGGEGAVTAMMEAMNDMTQRVYAQSAHASTQLIEAAAAKMNASAAKSMNDAISKRTVQSTLQATNPALSNPAVSPLIEMATNQLQQKHPTASPQEITAMVNSYITGLAEVFQAPQVAAAKQKESTAAAAKEEDWTKFFDPSPNPFG